MRLKCGEHGHPKGKSFDEDTVSQDCALTAAGAEQGISSAIMYVYTCVVVTWVLALVQQWLVFVTCGRSLCWPYDTGDIRNQGLQVLVGLSARVLVSYCIYRYELGQG